MNSFPQIYLVFNAILFVPLPCISALDFVRVSFNFIYLGFKFLLPALHVHDYGCQK